MVKRFLLTGLFLFLSLAISIPVWSQPKSLGAIATQHPLATEAGARVLQEGGNAIDAAVAVALTLAVVEPYNSGLGAGGMALIWEKTKHKAFAVDFRERAPLAATAGLFTSPGIPPDASREGPLAIAVPGEVAGLWALHQRWGHLPWKSLFTEAIRYAEQGFVADLPLRQRILKKQNCLSRDYHSSQIYQPFFSLPNLRKLSSPSPAPAEENFPRFVQTNLATTLKRLREVGARDFYQGRIAQQLVTELQAKGALLSLKDLQTYRAVTSKALAARFPWGKLWEAPLPTSGGISVLRSLNTLEALENKSRGRNRWIPWLVEIFGRVFQDRNSEMGDPNFVSGIPVKKWISKSFARGEAKQILKNIPLSAAPSSKSATAVGQTTHLSVIDAEGNAVSMTLTHNLSFGSCVTAGKTGILLNDQMDDFAIRPGAPNAFGLIQSAKNAVAGGKRPLSSISPTLVTRNKKVILAIGTPGGPRIISTLAQILYRYFNLQEDLAEAVRAPRFHYQDLPHRIFLEENASLQIQKALEATGIPLKREGTWGNVQWVTYDPHTKALNAGSDPRGEGLGMVVKGKSLTTAE